MSRTSRTNMIGQGGQILTEFRYQFQMKGLFYRQNRSIIWSIWTFNILVEMLTIIKDGIGSIYFAGPFEDYFSKVDFRNVKTIRTLNSIINVQFFTNFVTSTLWWGVSKSISAILKLILHPWNPFVWRRIKFSLELGSFQFSFYSKDFKKLILEPIWFDDLSNTIF